MCKTSKPKAKVTVIIRVINSITEPTNRTLILLSPYVDQILLIFSGSEKEYLTVTERFIGLPMVKVLWVYSFGYLEPILRDIKDEISNPWLMFLTDRDEPSKSLAESLNELTKGDVSAFMINRIINDSTNHRNIPSWLKGYLTPGWKKGYIPVLYKRDKIVISEIIHNPHKIQGKVEFLNPSAYYILREYSSRDMESDRVFLDHWIEKEKRYILIEMFETRKSRASVLSLLTYFIPFLNKFIPEHKYVRFLSKELSIIEYILFELLRSFSWGKIGLDPYQKVKISTIKDTKKVNVMGFYISEFLRKRNNEEKLTKFLKMESSIVRKENNVFNDLIIVKNSEIIFIKHLMKRFVEINKEWSGLDMDHLVDYVQFFLNINAEKYMPKDQSLVE